MLYSVNLDRKTVRLTKRIGFAQGELSGRVSLVVHRHSLNRSHLGNLFPTPPSVLTDFPREIERIDEEIVEELYDVLGIRGTRPWDSEAAFLAKRLYLALEATSTGANVPCSRLQRSTRHSRRGIPNSRCS